MAAVGKLEAVAHAYEILPIHRSSGIEIGNVPVSHPLVDDTCPARCIAVRRAGISARHGNTIEISAARVVRVIGRHVASLRAGCCCSHVGSIRDRGHLQGDRATASAKSEWNEKGKPCRCVLCFSCCLVIEPSNCRTAPGGGLAVSGKAFDRQPSRRIHRSQQITLPSARNVSEPIHWKARFRGLPGAEAPRGSGRPCPVGVCTGSRWPRTFGIETPPW